MAYLDSGAQDLSAANRIRVLTSVDGLTWLWNEAVLTPLYALSRPSVACDAFSCTIGYMDAATDYPEVCNVEFSVVAGTAVLGTPRCQVAPSLGLEFAVGASSKSFTYGIAQVNRAPADGEFYAWNYADSLFPIVDPYPTHPGFVTRIAYRFAQHFALGDSIVFFAR